MSVATFSECQTSRDYGELLQVRPHLHAIPVAAMQTHHGLSETSTGLVRPTWVYGLIMSCEEVVLWLAL